MAGNRGALTSVAPELQQPPGSGRTSQWTRPSPVRCQYLVATVARPIARLTPPLPAAAAARAAGHASRIGRAAGCGGTRNLRSRPVIRMILTTDGLGETSRNGQPRPLRVTGHPDQGTQTLGIAETQRGQVHNDRPMVAIDDAADVSDSHFGGGEIQLAADGRDGLAGRQDPVTQLKLFLHSRVGPPSEHHGRRSARDHPPPGTPLCSTANGEGRRRGRLAPAARPAIWRLVRPMFPMFPSRALQLAVCCRIKGARGHWITARAGLNGPRP